MSRIKMFDNYPQPETYIPDNRFRFLKCPKFEEVVIGADCLHTFQLPFLFNENYKDCIIIYKRGITLKLVKYINSFNIEEIPCEKDNTMGKTFIRVNLTPEETKLFSDGLGTHDTYVQLKLWLNDGSIEYTEKIPVKVMDTLDKGDFE